MTMPDRALQLDGDRARTGAVTVQADLRAWALLVTIVGGSLWLTALLAPHVGAPIATTAATAAGILAIAASEWVWPYERAWLRSHGDVMTDVLHASLSDHVVKQLVRALTQGGTVLVAGALAARLGGGLWPAQWPLAVQLGLALLVAELVQYWLHRLEHRWDGLWRFHATHHSAPRLYWLNAARLHPVDATLLYLTSFTILIVLGCPEIVLALFAVFDAVFGVIQHSNIRLALGPLSWILSTPELHRWHHSRVLEEANANYGSNLIVWDLVFGTYFLPADRRPPTDIGVAEMPSFPQDYWGQILSPLRWRALRGD
jgi:sterol desaturase/sphingolipid hydroxylase (fatty acid hydroxylase superfamily)